MKATEKTTVSLPAGQVLTLTVAAAATGNITRLADSPGGEPFSPVAINGANLTFGPYAATRRYAVSCDVGTVVPTIGVANPADLDGAQTLAGIKSFSSMPRFPASTVVAAGSTQADAAALAEGYNLVTGANATKGVKLPPAAGGSFTQFVAVKNSDAAAAILKVYSGGTPDIINALAASAAYSMASKTTAIFFNYQGAWASFPLLAS